MSTIDYDHKKVEKKWALEWVKRGIFAVKEDPDKKKSYILIEFPYPSGERLHVGHARSYSCLDAVVRKRRMQGENVMFPFGWDAFGLPAENYAVKTGIHPAVTTAKNIENSRKQVISWGMSFDWSREVNTTDPAYYKWTQWIFLQLFKAGLAYKAEIAVNWCPSCKINLANEEVIDGKCERCGTLTQRRTQSQWLLRITAYADRLLEDLEKVDYRSDIKQQQINWIGKKNGITINYQISNLKSQIAVFTTRPETSFGATFIVVAPEHSLVKQIIDQPRSGLGSDLKGFKGLTPDVVGEIKVYVGKATNKSELERVAKARKKTGVFSGLYAVNNLNQEKMPIWISDFVLASVGTGAVMGVPGHDRRDFEFASQMGIPIKRVVVGTDNDQSEITNLSQVQEENGVMVNSGFLDSLDIHAATAKMTDYLEEKGWGKRAVTYHLRDWVFSRQHYWGEPTPVLYCKECAKQGKSWFTGSGAKEWQKISNLKSPMKRFWLTFQDKQISNLSGMAGWFPVPEADLPVLLPRLEKYQPTETGESPLANITEWVNTTCPECGGQAKRETDVMPNWAGSSWYYLRYCDPVCTTAIGLPQKLAYWLPVDWYNGGMEHTTLHLLYSRFWHKFLYDLGVVPTPEPYARRTSHGVVLGPDGRRMSKSRGNVINPDDIMEKFGADTLRMYEMFIGPFEQMVVWNDSAMAGVSRFLKRVWGLSCEIMASRRDESSSEVRHHLAGLIAKVDRDLEAMKFNTAVAAAMEFINIWEEKKSEVGLDTVRSFVLVLAPMAPFIAEELWQKIHEPQKSFGSVHLQGWPVVEEGMLEDKIVNLVVQVNGRVREKIAIFQSELNEEHVKQTAMESAKVKDWLKGEQPARVVWVPGKLINFVTAE